MNRPIVIEPGGVLLLFVSWLALLAGAFALGVHVA